VGTLGGEARPARAICVAGRRRGASLRRILQVSDMVQVARVTTVDRDYSRLWAPFPKGDNIETRISCVENRPSDAAQLRTQPSVGKRGRLRCILEMAPMMK
jgi:hypothetical protein